MAQRWVQNPAIPGDPGKRYVTAEKAAVLATAGWTETTQPADFFYPANYLITRGELQAALEAAGLSVPDATALVKGKARVMAGTADDPRYPASRIEGQVQDIQITPAVVRGLALPELVQDIVAAMLVPGTDNVSFVYNDSTGRLQLRVTTGTTTPPGGGFATAPFATTPFGGSS